MDLNIKENAKLFKMIWTASKRDLLMAAPWFPIYSLAEVCLAITSGMLLQLIFINTQQITLSSLLPGKFNAFFTTPYSFDREHILFLVPIVVTIVALIKLISRFLSSYLTERAGHRTSYYLRAKMLEQFLASNGNKIDQVNPDKLANQFMQDTVLLQEAVSKGTVSAIRDCVVLIGIVFSMLLISWKVFILGLFVVVPMTILLRQISRRMNFYTHEGQKKQINLSTRMLQTHQGSLVVNALRSHGRELADLEELNQDNYSFMRKSLFVRTFFSPVMEFIGISMLAVAVFWRMNTNVDLNVASYSAMMILLVFSFRYIKNIAGTITFFSDLHVVFKRVTTYFSEYQSNQKNVHLNYLPKYSSEAIIAKHISYHVSSDKKVLEDCSIKIMKGQKVAFIGESGAGKTSFLRTIAGLLEPCEGHISICEDYLMAFQSPYVFRGTVQENIIYNQADEITNRIEEKCHDLVLALSLAFTESGAQIFLNKKLNFLGEGLSGGEKARVALARILFSSPKLILLDEPTANLDAASSKFFWKAIEKWKAKDSDHTVVTVSHMIREVLDFDYCYVFENGKIINQGVPRNILNHV